MKDVTVYGPSLLPHSRSSKGKRKAGSVLIRMFSPRNLCGSAAPRLVSVEILLNRRVAETQRGESI